MPVSRKGYLGSSYVTVIVAVFVKCLRPICHQYARDCLRERQTYYQKQPRHTRDAILVACSKCLRLPELRPMDTCVGCRIVEYFVIVCCPEVADRRPICGCVLNANYAGQVAPITAIVRFARCLLVVRRTMQNFYCESCVCLT